LIETRITSRLSRSERSGFDRDSLQAKTGDHMDITLKPSGAVVAALAIIVLALQVVPQCQAQAPSPYLPPPDSVTISPQTQGSNVSVTVAVDLPDSCYYVGGWGQPTLVGSIAYVDTQFWVQRIWYCLPMVTTVSTNYSLGALLPGNYSFYLLVWGFQVKAAAFSVPEPSPPRLTISRLSDSQVRLSWPTNATNYSLERAVALPAPEWVTMTNRPPVIGDEFVLTIDSVGGQAFYRLRRL
jgi:hypothetical protein